MLTEDVKYRAEVLENGQIQVCRVTYILKDGVRMAQQLHRHVLGPGDSLEGQDSKVQAIANAVWTSEVITEYEEEQRKLKLDKK